MSAITRWSLAAAFVSLTACTVPVQPTGNGSGARGANAGAEAPNEDPAGPGEPSSEPATGGGGHVPASLVGVWTSGSGGAMIQYTFSADGSYHELSGLSSSGSCPLTNTWSIDGNVTFGSGTVTFDEVSGTRTSKTCTSENPPTPIVPARETKSWLLEGNVLYLWPADCQDYKTCGIDFDKQ